MKFKKGFVKKSLATLITSAALFVGSLGLGGCQSYSPLENQVYNYVNKFSKKIPKEFVKNDNFYHDESLIIEDVNKPEKGSGKGRFVARSLKPECILAGYINTEEFREFYSKKDPNELKTNIIFVGVKTEEEKEEVKEAKKLHDLLLLIKKKNCVLYIMENDKWKKISFEGFNISTIKAEIEKSEEIIREEEVKRYIDLAEKFKEIYFP